MQIKKINDRIIEWIDPFSKGNLTLKNNTLTSKNSKYLIYHGIPNFAKNVKNIKQLQVQKSFKEKWTKTNFAHSDNDFENDIKPIYLEMMGLSEKDLKIFNKKLVLEIGIGSGSSSRLWVSQAEEFHGIDISGAIFSVPKTLKNIKKQIILSQADLNFLPYKNESFDIIVANGVLHHTPSTKISLKNTLKKLKKGGMYIFYIYKKKSPIREFCDDHVRDEISKLNYSDALKKMKAFTEFGKSLSDQNISITIPKNIDLLGIKKGKYDLQRFIYDNFFKCFWNESWGYSNSNMVNFDWYHPTFCWRHTEQEIKSWCKELNLKIKYLKELESGFACSLQKK